MLFGYATHSSNIYVHSPASPGYLLFSLLLFIRSLVSSHSLLLSTRSLADNDKSWQRVCATVPLPPDNMGSWEEDVPVICSRPRRHRGTGWHLSFSAKIYIALGQRQVFAQFFSRRRCASDSGSKGTRSALRTRIRSTKGAWRSETTHAFLRHLNLRCLSLFGSVPSL